MKELVLKKQTELEDIYRRAHVEVDGTSARQGLMDQINSGNLQCSSCVLASIGD